MSQLSCESCKGNRWLVSESDRELKISCAGLKCKEPESRVILFKEKV